MPESTSTPPPLHIIETAIQLQAFIKTKHRFIKEVISDNLWSEIISFETAESNHLIPMKSTSPSFPIEWATRKKQVQAAVRRF